MSLPIMASMSFRRLQWVDSILVAKLSEDALTSQSPAFPVQDLMIAVGVGTSIGVNAWSAQIGRKE
jgi:Na+-driven multidrug efflux pump